MIILCGMKYYIMGAGPLTEGKRQEVGRYDTLEEALRELCLASEDHEIAYLYVSKTDSILAYMYHGIVEQKKKNIIFHFDRLKGIK